MNIKYKIKKMVPFRLKSSFKMRASSMIMCGADKIIVDHLKKNNAKRPVLQCGWRKSGTTWTKFVVFNYFNILINNADRTLTFNELAALDTHDLREGGGGSVEPFEPGFPIYYGTHAPHRKIFKHFHSVIYIYRNPLDAIVSFYHNLMNRFPESIRFSRFLSVSEREKMSDIDYFTLFYMPVWIYHYKSSIGKSDAILCYEKVKENPYKEFSHLFEKAGFKLKKELLQKSIEMSSSENLKKMAKEKNQIYGYNNPESFKGKFLRSGKVGQYHDELKPETIKKAREMLARYSVDVEV